MTLLDYLDVTFGFCREKKAAAGEDSWCYSFNEHAGLLGVFDGCGGAGATAYDALKLHTGAFVASRAVADAAMRWFFDLCGGETAGIAALEQRIRQNLAICTAQTGNQTSRIRSAMMRRMPTTAAMWVVTENSGRLHGVSISAGDSRTYLLDRRGLMQISADDLRGEDAMSDIYNGAPMTNVISADGAFQLHCATRVLSEPCVLLAATDGCFNYLKSPMEFEYLLLHTLMEADCIDRWDQMLQQEIDAVAGDDQTMAVAVFGYQSFPALQASLAPRHEAIKLLVQSLRDDIEARQRIWAQYKAGYYSLADGGVPTVE